MLAMWKYFESRTNGYANSVILNLRMRKWFVAHQTMKDGCNDVHKSRVDENITLT